MISDDGLNRRFNAEIGFIAGMDTVQASGMDASKRANTAALQVSDGVKRWLSGARVCWTASDIHD